MRYAITALFDHPVNGVSQRCCSDRGQETVHAETAESAARMFLHRLPPEEHLATVRVLVSAPAAGETLAPVYTGPVIEFVRVNGRLELVE